MKQAIRAYYGFQICFPMLLWTPIFYEFQKQIGLSDEQIFSIQSIYYIAFCLFEIPTGLLADHWGYKKCLTVGSIFLVAANCFPIFFQSYFGLVSHFLLIALSRSLVSGASSAYLYETLHQNGAARSFKTIEGNSRAFGLVAKVACWSGVGTMMKWQLTLPYWISAGFSLLAIYFTYLLPKFVPLVKKEDPAQKSESAMLLQVMQIFARTPTLLLLIVQGIGIFVLVRICQVSLFQPILTAKSFNLASFGLVMSIMCCFEALGSFGLVSKIAARVFRGSFSKVFIEHKNREKNLVYFLTMIMALSLVLIPTSNQILTIIFLCVFSLASGVAYPLQRQLINDHIPDPKYRATLLSVESVVDRGVNAWAALIIGQYLAAGRMDEFLTLSGTITLMAMGSLLFLGFVFSSKKENLEGTI